MAHVYMLALVVVFALTFLITRLWRRMRHRHYDVPARDIRKGHRWVMTDIFSHPVYCSVSENPLVSGGYCDSCGICVEDHYLKEANKKFKCKELANTNEVHVHQWIKTTMPPCHICDICGEECGSQHKLSELRCCWCWRVAHEGCAQKAGVVCDLGTFKHNIIPPNCVRLKLVGIKGRRHFVVDSVKHPPINNWHPLIVIANQKSGNGDSAIILQAFRGLLNPAQVIDLADLSPESGLEWCHLLPLVTCRVLVAGGDGTVGWVLQAIDQLNLKRPPEVCVLPLGTGNDLSRVLGWGQGKTGDIDVRDLLEQMAVAQVVKLDRWRVEITPEKHFGIRLPKKTLFMNNYVSIGVDALVTLNFHRHRESRPSLFGSRLINKLWYFTYGTKDVLERECKHLHKKLQVELDGTRVDLPEIEGIVLLNIASWGGGCRPWELGSATNNRIPQARYDDGLIEVLALYSSFHIAQLQVGMAEPLRLGQAKTVKLTLRGGNAPMQVDGEPWEQHPAVITVSHHNQATMLAYLT